MGLLCVAVFFISGTPFDIPSICSSVERRSSFSTMLIYYSADNIKYKSFICHYSAFCRHFAGGILTKMRARHDTGAWIEGIENFKPLFVRLYVETATIYFILYNVESISVNLFIYFSFYYYIFNKFVGKIIQCIYKYISNSLFNAILFH